MIQRCSLFLFLGYPSSGVALFVCLEPVPGMTNIQSHGSRADFFEENLFPLLLFTSLPHSEPSKFPSTHSSFTSMNFPRLPARPEITLQIPLFPFSSTFSTLLPSRPRIRKFYPTAWVPLPDSAAFLFRLALAVVACEWSTTQKPNTPQNNKTPPKTPQHCCFLWRGWFNRPFFLHHVFPLFHIIFSQVDSSALRTIIPAIQHFSRSPPPEHARQHQIGFAFFPSCASGPSSDL